MCTSPAIISRIIAGLSERRLLINRCDDCGTWIYPHRPLCPNCWSWSVQPKEVSGLGRVYMFTLLHQLRDPKAMIYEPMPVAAVELVEQDGLRYLSRIVHCKEQEIEHGMRVQLTWIEVDGNSGRHSSRSITMGAFMARNPLKDQIAIIGVGSTAYGRDLKRSPLSLGLEAAIRAIEDAGIDKQAVDGICGTGMTPLAMGNAGFLSLQGALGIEQTTWAKNGWLGSAFVLAAEAVFSGLCDTALVVQAYTREPGMSRAASADPFRARAQAFGEVGGDVFCSDFAKRWLHSGEPYAAWMRRYMYQYGTDGDAFALMAVNNRSHASRNPEA